MRYIKYLFSTLFLLLCSVALNAHDFEINGIYYNITSESDKQAEVTFKGYKHTSYSNEYSGSINIPATVTYNGRVYSVTSIGEHAFAYCSSLTAITIPESVTSIESYAFSDCNSLTAITIPESVTSIGTYAFSRCSSLTAITIPESVTRIISGAFAYCSSLTTIVVAVGNKIYDSCTDCNAIIETGSNTLIQGCSATIIPESVTSIASCAFYGCSNLTAITIPESVTSIGSRAFEDCSSLTAITIPESVTSIKSNAFEGCTSLIAITIPENSKLTSIEWNVFHGCSSLTAITIPESVTSIENYAFYECTSLTTITLPDGVIIIESNAFEGCTSLTTIVLPKSTWSIGSNAFANCSELTDVYCYAEKVPSTGANAFDGSYIESVTLHVPTCAINSYKTTSPWSSFGKFKTTKIAVESIILSQSSAALIEGETLTLNAMVAPDDTEDKSVIWSSSNPSVATVDNTGKVTAIEPGVTTITVKANDGSGVSASCKVTVTPASYVITFFVDGYIYMTETLIRGSAISLPDVPTKEGYTFSGWGEVPDTMPAEDVIINGSFSINSYTITYMIDGKVYKTETYNYGDTIVAEIAPDKSGYTFSGWEGLPNTMPANDLIIVGEYELNEIYTDEQGVQYRINENYDGYIVSSTTKESASDIVIPANVYGLPVTVIDDKAFVALKSLTSITIPDNINKVGKDAFYGCEGLLLVEWNTTAPLNADCFDEPERHGNMLVLVKNSTTKVGYKGNVVVGGVAEQITISDDMSFRSPQQFVARNITFTKNFDKKTKIGTSGGWEAMMLPFDVQRVVSETRGELKPFGEADFDTSLPYWLGELQADGTFAATQRIVANKPFIMQLPNSDEYEDIYNVEGKVTFSAEEVTVHATTDVEQEKGVGYSLLGSYEGTESDNYIYALNDEEYTVGGDTYMSGGVFVAGSRDIRPFEAYIYSASANRAPYLRIGGCDTGMVDLVADKDEVWHTLQGIRLSDRPTERGVYIRNGKKIMVK